MPVSLKQGCRSFQQSLKTGRRDFLRAGVLGAGAAWGLSLSNLLRSEAQAARPGRSSTRGKSVIILWMRGGPSHIDMWDMKPDAPTRTYLWYDGIPTSVLG
jgi:uncharacterized protein (DUF1501 family)